MSEFLTFDSGSKEEKVVEEGLAILLQVQTGGVGKLVSHVEALLCSFGRMGEEEVTKSELASD